MGFIVYRGSVCRPHFLIKIIIIFSDMSRFGKKICGYIQYDLYVGRKVGEKLIGSGEIFRTYWKCKRANISISAYPTGTGVEPSSCGKIPIRYISCSIFRNIFTKENRSVQEIQEFCKYRKDKLLEEFLNPTGLMGIGDESSCQVENF